MNLTSPITERNLSQHQRREGVMQTTATQAIPVALGAIDCARLNHNRTSESSSANLKETPGEVKSSLNVGSENLGRLKECLDIWIEEGPLEKKTSRKEAAKKIFKCFEKKDVALNLSRFYFTSLPSEICQLSQLIMFWLDNNQLQALSPEFVQLTQLEALNLNNNQFRELPSEIFQLTQLKVLSLNRNQLRDLTSEIGQSSQLEMLSFEGNQLQTLPLEIGQLSQLKDLVLKDNLLTGLPNSIFNLRSSCDVHLERNPFPLRVLRNLQQAVNAPNYQGPRFFFSIHDRHQQDSQPIEIFIKSVSELAERELIVLKNLARNETLRSWLSRLVDVKDFQGPNRKQLAKKIYDALIQAEKDETFREVFLNCIMDASETCGDRVTHSILYLGLNLRIYNCKNLGELAYLLGHGTIALKELEAIARNKVKELLCVDEIEVYLAYPVKLKEKLKLPININSMLYFSCSGVTDDDLSIAEGIVKAILSDTKIYCQHLVENKIWQNAIDKHNPEHRQKCSEAFKNGCDGVKAQQEYINAILKITQQTLEENPPPFLKPQEEGSSQGSPNLTS